MIDLVADSLGRRLVEVPVGFKWFVEGLIDGSLGFGGEESAGASFLRRDGTPWSTDKDGILLALLAAEITATTGRDPGVAYGELTERFGAPAYRRVDSPIDPERKEKLLKIEPSDITADELAGDKIENVLTRAPGNDAADRRREGGERRRLVRRPAVGHGGHLQALRREPPRRGAPRADHRRRAGDPGMTRVLTMVLAGGEGKRLAPLTADRAKPAVPFGGNYRLIDFALSNLVNANYHQIVVLTQYK